MSCGRRRSPGRGHSSPVLWGDRVFLTTADEQAKKQIVLAFDRNTGKELWRFTAHEGGLVNKNPKNSHASATCACDGERVYSVFLNSDAVHVTATDLDGKKVWQREAGPFKSEHGYGASPVLFESLVIVLGDNLTSSFLAALDRKTGAVVWRKSRPATGKHGSYGTPTVATLAGKPQLLVTGMSEVVSYDPATGDPIWTCKGPAEVTGCTPAVGGGLVFASGGFPEKELLAIRADGTGDVTKTHMAWRTNKDITYVPSPVYHDGHLYVVSDSGLATCFEAATGQVVWKERLEGSFTASPVLADGLIFVTNEAGKTSVVKAGPKFELVATNDLGEPTLATLAICGGRIFLRTDKTLYSLGVP